MAGRFIKLYDKILKWEWYGDINTFRLFIHLLLKANYKDLRFEGRKILRGQLVTSLASLSSQTGLSVRQVRVSLDHLKMTGEVTSTVFSKYRVITIVRYDEYQGDDRLVDKQMTSELTSKRQADDKQMTSKRQANDKQVTTSIEQIEQIEQVEQVERGRAPRFTPPTREELETFCWENRLGIDVDRFLDYYTANGWMAGKNHMKDWRAAARNWARRDESDRRKPAAASAASSYDQRSYSGFDAGSFMDQLMNGEADV